MRSVFGWSYPPGAANDPNAPYNQTDSPCDVCGQFEDDCICPECPVCHTIGDPTCYDGADHCPWCGIRPNGSDHSRCREAEQMGPNRELVVTSIPSHGLVRSFAQVALWAEAERQWEAEARAEAAIADHIDGYDRDDLGESPDY